MDNAIPISLIVCSHDRPALLDRCLATVFSQTMPRDRFEVVVVDNGATGATSRVAAPYRAMDNLRAVREPVPGVSNARNRGCAEAAGTYLVYVDDDTMLPEGFLETVADAVGTHRPDIMAGPVRPYYTRHKPFWFRDRYETWDPGTGSGFSTTCGISGTNLVIRKETLVRLGMFDPSLGMRGREIGFGEVLKVLETYRRSVPPEEQRVYFSAESFILHHVPPRRMRLHSMLAHAFLAGRSAARMRGYTGARSVVMLAGLPLRCAVALHRELRTAGAAAADYIELLRRAAHDAGAAADGVLRSVRTAARLVRRAALRACGELRSAVRRRGPGKGQ